MLVRPLVHRRFGDEGDREPLYDNGSADGGDGGAELPASDGRQECPDDQRHADDENRSGAGRKQPELRVTGPLQPRERGEPQHERQRQQQCGHVAAEELAVPDRGGRGRQSLRDARAGERVLRPAEPAAQSRPLVVSAEPQHRGTQLGEHDDDGDRPRCPLITPHRGQRHEGERGQTEDRHRSQPRPRRHIDPGHDRRARTGEHGERQQNRP